MIENIKALFESTGKNKIEFRPEIRLPRPEGAQPIWVDQMMKVKDTITVRVATNDDSMMRRLDSLGELELIKLHAGLRLFIDPTLREPLPTKSFTRKTKANGKSRLHA